MKLLTDGALIEVYISAKKKNLEEDFIVLLLAEFQRRKLPVPNENENVDQ
ncbi:sporulation histidine kinase inhibitor Sda [Paenibacillus flagellatus]|uniref:Sporulation histidine kinase inhibitor Sda n=1 Tax=Paenibacillus flagellatus TaxID=2211139 RepID=A0A2V5JV78_9BACL|nr:sporulation histidine kinase inhibitor Sda [Paenibacillus flagellatus]PYI49992.1 sporulation histidine kinase inhibitor Sda [Paenibacillus flagellatus]